MKKQLHDYIGNTPLVHLDRFAGVGEIYCKLECFNPWGSIKDRIAKSMVDDAFEKGLIMQGGVVVVPTSGNTGIAVAGYSKSKGCRVIITISKTDADNNIKLNLMRALADEVVICDTPTDVDEYHESSYVMVGKKLAKEKNGLFLDQYSHVENPMVHYKTTGPEIYEQMDRSVTHFFAGIGSGGTITGVSRYLKEKNPSVKTILVDVQGSLIPQILGKSSAEIPYSPGEIRGIGNDFLPKVVEKSLIDDYVIISDESSFKMMRRLASECGIVAGASSGAIVGGAIEYLEKSGEDCRAVCILPDSGLGYLNFY